MDTISDYERKEQEECGPPRPLMTAESPEALRRNLKAEIAKFENDPPFTIQRLCEVVLEPGKQYRTLDKYAMSVEKLLLVSSTVPFGGDLPPLPRLGDLPPVNECPPPVRASKASPFPDSWVPNGTAGPPQGRAGIDPEGGTGLAGAVLHAPSGSGAEQHGREAQGVAT